MSCQKLLLTGLLLAGLAIGDVGAAAPKAADTLQSRQAAAKVYLTIQPVSKMYQDAVLQMAENFPADKREQFIKDMNDAVDIPKLEQLAVESLVKNFSTPELNVMTSFYSSKEGKAIYDKMPNYLSDIVQGMRSVIRPLSLSPESAPPQQNQSPDAQTSGNKTPENSVEEMLPTLEILP